MMVRPDKIMEELLKEIYVHHVKLDRVEARRNNRIIGKVIRKLKEILQRDPTFNQLFLDVFYGGSYYDQLKIKQPDEYDLNFRFNPQSARPDLEISNRPGFLQAKITNLDSPLKLFVDEDNYLSVTKLNTWFDKLVRAAVVVLNEKFKRVLDINNNGPAVTIKVRRANVTFDMDLVPVFHFGASYWPQNGYTQFAKREEDGFFIVPKSIKSDEFGKRERYWRISFQIQERIIILNKVFLKMSIKLLKYLRDQENEKLIKSYFIKTVALLAIDASPNGLFKGKSLYFTFDFLLGELQECMTKENIPYFWNRKYNLLEGQKPEFFENVANRLLKIKKSLEDGNTEKFKEYFGV